MNILLEILVRGRGIGGLALDFGRSVGRYLVTVAYVIEKYEANVWALERTDSAFQANYVFDTYISIRRLSDN